MSWSAPSRARARERRCPPRAAPAAPPVRCSLGACCEHQHAVEVIHLVLDHPRLQARGLDRELLAAGSTALTLMCSGRSTSTTTPGQAEAALLGGDQVLLGGPLDPGLTSAVSGASAPAWKTRMRRRMPSCVAARPTPIPSCIRLLMRSTSAARASSNSSTGEATERSTGSPNLTTCASAAVAALEALGIEARGGLGLGRELVLGRIGRVWGWLCHRPFESNGGPRADPSGRRYCGSTSTEIATSPRRAAANRRRDRVAHRRDGGAPLGRLQQQPAAVLAPQPEERRRAEQVDVRSAGARRPARAARPPPRRARSGSGEARPTSISGEKGG